MRTILFVIYTVLHTVYTLYHLLIVYILGLMGMKEEQEARITGTARNWGKALVLVSGSKVQLEGADLVPRDRAVLYVSNHQSYFDIPLLLGFVPGDKGFIAKIELARIPIVSTWMKKMHSLFLDRENLRKSLLTMREAIDILKGGHSLVIFPEGTRSKGGPVAPFKRGSLSIADKAKVPVVPVSISGTYKILEANKGFKIRPAVVKVHISEPIYPWELQPGADLAEMVRERIVSTLDE